MAFQMAVIGDNSEGRFMVKSRLPWFVKTVGSKNWRQNQC